MRVRVDGRSKISATVLAASVPRWAASEFGAIRLQLGGAGEDAARDLLGVSSAPVRKCLVTRGVYVRGGSTGSRALIEGRSA